MQKVSHISLRLRICMVASLGLLMACSSTRQRDTAQAPASNDLLELLTGFGESLSKRNFLKAVDYMVPEEKAMMMEAGTVPDDKQKMLLALPLQKLIRHPGIRVENGHIAGIYAVLPNLRQGEAMATMAPDESSENTPLMGAEVGTEDQNLNQNGAESMGLAARPEPIGADEVSESTPTPNPNDPQLQETVNKFFSAVNKKNWTMALALVNDEEKKFLLDDKGRLKESSKQRLSQMDQKNRDALLLQDGKLSGITLLLPSN